VLPHDVVAVIPLVLKVLKLPETAIPGPIVVDIVGAANALFTSIMAAIGTDIERASDFLNFI